MSGEESGLGTLRERLGLLPSVSDTLDSASRADLHPPGMGGLSLQSPSPGEARELSKGCQEGRGGVGILRLQEGQKVPGWEER